MKVITVALTDTHFHKENWEDVIDIFKQAGKLALKLKCKFITHIGDIFTNRIGQNLQTLLAFKRVLDELEANGLILLAIPGNHDKTDLDSPNSYLDVFSDHPAFKLFAVESTIEINSKLNFSFLPYFSTSYLERLNKLNKSLDLKRNNVLFTHIDINGVRNNDGSEVTEGIEPGKFKKYDKVFVGHYHNASDIGDNIHYIGSAYQANFGETIDDKGFLILNEDLSIRFVNSTFKKYIKIKLDVSDKARIKDELEALEGSEDNIRFVFTGKRADLDSINISTYTDLGIDCKFESEETTEAIEAVEGNEFVLFDKKTIIKNFIDFCKTNEIPSNKRNLGLKFLKES